MVHLPPTDGARPPMMWKRNPTWRLRKRLSGCQLLMCSTQSDSSMNHQNGEKKIAAAVYKYQADCDGEWSKIQLDFENGAVETVRLAVWDTIGSKVFT